jgi:metallophosphoesterase (TIGR00282 family)
MVKSFLFFYKGVILKILLIGDLMGKPGRWAVSQLLPDLKKINQIDFVIANVENAAGGFGLTKEIASKVYSYGVNVLTSGNHIWDRKEIYEYLNKEPNILRPANYPARDPGKGSVVYQMKDGTKIGVLNIQGRVYMKEIDCPFRIADQEIEKLKPETNLIIVDIHAEATSEKMALGWYLDGRVSAVIGTHTHVQTVDEIILPGGTAFITDVGMTGGHNSVIGIIKEDAITRFLTQIPNRFRIAKDDIKFCAVSVEIDQNTGKALKIERIRIDMPPINDEMEGD